MFIPYKLCCARSIKRFCLTKKKVEITPEHKTLSSAGRRKVWFISLLLRSKRWKKIFLAILHRKNVFWQSPKDVYRRLAAFACVQSTDSMRMLYVHNFSRFETSIFMR